MKYPYVLALKEPTSNKPTLIYFKAYLRAENKRFKYSTGEKIHPKYWDFIIKKPKELTGRTKTAIELRSINRQLQRYVNKYEDIRSYYDNINEILTISTLKNEFDKEFRLGFSGVNEFFRSYDEFLQSKRERKENSQGTIYRYEYLKSLLKDFANIKKYNLRFSTINSNFEDKFLGYCRANKGHSNNTIGRNIGLLKTFMYWAERVGKHTNTAFKSIRKTKHEPDEIALTDKQFEQLFKHDLSHNKRLEKVRDVFIFGCSTGLRYSDYHRVGKRHINDGNIRLTSKKIEQIEIYL